MNSYYQHNADADAEFRADRAKIRKMPANHPVGEVQVEAVLLLATQVARVAHVLENWQEKQ